MLPIVYSSITCSTKCTNEDYWYPRKLEVDYYPLPGNDSVSYDVIDYKRFNKFEWLTPRSHSYVRDGSKKCNVNRKYLRKHLKRGIFTARQLKDMQIISPP